MGASGFYACDFQNHFCSDGGETGTDEKRTRRVRRAATRGFDMCRPHALLLSVPSLLRRVSGVSEFLPSLHVIKLSLLLSSSMDLCRLVRPSPMLT